MTRHLCQDVRINGSKLRPTEDARLWGFARGDGPCGFGGLWPHLEPHSPSGEPPWPRELREEQGTLAGGEGATGRGSSDRDDPPRTHEWPPGPAAAGASAGDLSRLGLLVPGSPAPAS